MSTKPVPTTRQLIGDHGTKTKLVCGCCGSASVWDIGEFTLCSWCDVDFDNRWKS